MKQPRTKSWFLHFFGFKSRLSGRASLFYGENINVLPEENGCFSLAKLEMPTEQSSMEQMEPRVLYSC